MLLLQNNNYLNIAAPLFVKEEWKEHREETAEKAGLSITEAMVFFIILNEKVQFYATEKIKENIEQAKSIAYDADDIEYLALALKLNCPLWSEDKDMKKQSLVKILNTKELLNEV